MRRVGMLVLMLGIVTACQPNSEDGNIVQATANGSEAAPDYEYVDVLANTSDGELVNQVENFVCEEEDRKVCDNRFALRKAELESRGVCFLPGRPRQWIRPSTAGSMNGCA
jgi:hypothetical protein